MLTATIQAKTKPQTKKNFAKLAKLKGVKVSNLLNTLVEQALAKQNHEYNIENFKQILLVNSVSKDEDSQLQQAYNFLYDKE
jgi:hypothetical protein